MLIYSRIHLVTSFGGIVDGDDDQNAINTIVLTLKTIMGRLINKQKRKKKIITQPLMFIMNTLYKTTILLYLVQDFFFILFQWINNVLTLFYYKNNQKQSLLVKYKLKLFICLLLKKNKNVSYGKAFIYTRIFL